MHLLSFFITKQTVITLTNEHVQICSNSYVSRSLFNKSQSKLSTCFFPMAYLKFIFQKIGALSELNLVQVWHPYKFATSIGKLLTMSYTKPIFLLAMNLKALFLNRYGDLFLVSISANLHFYIFCYFQTVCRVHDMFPLSTSRFLTVKQIKIRLQSPASLFALPALIFSFFDRNYC